jgi:DNA-binding HxlR family transcriptional regulator
MRSYSQYCAVAKALDVVGDRWTLLIVRELLLRGGCRYTDLRDGLPGIATNLLADRLRQLEDAGLVAREEAPPPIATTLFRLTPRGEELRSVIDELGRWGFPLMVEGPNDDAFRPHWLALPVELSMADRAPERPPVTIEVRAGEAPFVIETLDGAVRARPGAADHADAVVSGTPYVVAGLVSGMISFDDAVALGLECKGNSRALRRLLPREPARPVTGAR